ncbi:MAG TPA: diguanylate cyclase [Casimicrobium huifangae]|nr:diguanylate cyclase [Casimicrobium huifangae]
MVASPVSSAAAASEHTSRALAIGVMLEAGRLQDALRDAEEALRGCDDEERPILLCMKCNALVTLGQPLDALRVATAARELALPMGRPLLVAEANLALSFALQALEEHDRAIDLAAECEDIATTHQDQELLARSSRTLAISYSILGRHQQAIPILERVVQQLEQHARTPERLFHARYSLINARSRLSSTDRRPETEKLDTYRGLLADWLAFVEDVEARNLLRLRAMALGNAGIAARLAGDNELALQILARARDEEYRLGLRGHGAVSESHLGAAYQALGRPQEAIAAFRSAIDKLKEGNPRDLAGAWEELAAAYESVGDTAAALDALKQTRAAERRLRDDAAHSAAGRQERRDEVNRLAEQWTRLASEDGLTALANRRAFDRKLAALAEAAKTGHPFAVVLFDLDHFKQINDTHGHAIGDAVLKRFAAILRSERRTDDLAARIGGEEFALLLVAASVEQARAVAVKVQKELDRVAWPQIAERLVVTVSAGIACSAEALVGASSETNAGDCADALLAAADRRLYAAKAAGRNRVVMSD